MADLNQVDNAALSSQKSELERRYQGYLSAGLKLDMTRGKPCAEQLDLSSEMLNALGPSDFKSASGVDCRNYGGVDGLPEAKALFAQFLEVSEEEVIVGGNSSLTLMYESVAHACSHGVPGGSAPWRGQGNIKFLCPTPGYDRHFSVCEHQRIEMIAVPTTEQGPDMAVVERLAAQDDSIKGIWVVPKYSNPTGVTLSDAVVERLASMKAAPDFRIFWDNAYTVHHLTSARPSLRNIQSACKDAGNPDRALLFGSTSKISFAGAGVAVMGGSPANMDWMRGHLSMMTIGPDKLNQLRHVRFFKDMAGIEAHMAKHAAIIAPKFDAVDRVLSRELAGLQLATWNKPIGGYFISFDAVAGCASRVVELARKAGVTLTNAGATFPYGKDPNDQNIRIAPSLPSLAEIEEAMGVFAVCVKLATLEQLSRVPSS